MKGLGRVITAIAVAGGLPSGVGAVCIDEHGISGYHIPLDTEFRTAHVVAIGTVVSKRDVLERNSDLIAGTFYRFNVEETLRGNRHKTINLFSENNSGRFWMDIGHRYLVFVTKDRQTYYVSPCGSSGELPEQSQIVEALKEKVRRAGKGEQSGR